jgi:hypothetical protein
VGISQLQSPYPPQAFFLGEVFLIVICLNHAMRLSGTGAESGNLAQEVALLPARLERVDPGRRLAG